MAQQEWDVLINLGDEVPHYVGAMKAWDEQEAKEKGTRLAMAQGLSGVIKVQPSESVERSDVDYHTW